MGKTLTFPPAYHLDDFPTGCSKFASKNAVVESCAVIHQEIKRMIQNKATSYISFRHKRSQTIFEKKNPQQLELGLRRECLILSFKKKLRSRVACMHFWWRCLSVDLLRDLIRQKKWFPVRPWHSPRGFGGDLAQLICGLEHDALLRKGFNIWLQSESDRRIEIALENNWCYLQ